MDEFGTRFVSLTQEEPRPRPLFDFEALSHSEHSNVIGVMADSIFDPDVPESIKLTTIQNLSTEADKADEHRKSMTDKWLGVLSLTCLTGLLALWHEACRA